jgi:hypothetical protein
MEVSNWLISVSSWDNSLTAAYFNLCFLICFIWKQRDTTCLHHHWLTFHFHVPIYSSLFSSLLLPKNIDQRNNQQNMLSSSFITKLCRSILPPTQHTCQKEYICWDTLLDGTGSHCLWASIRVRLRQSMWRVVLRNHRNRIGGRRTTAFFSSPNESIIPYSSKPTS